MTGATEIQLDLDQLRCRSVIDAASTRSSSCQLADLATTEAPVHVMPLDDVLYVPDLWLQIVDGGTVPLEAIRDCWYLGFLQRGWRDNGDPLTITLVADRRDDEVCVLSTVFTRAFGEWMQELFKVLLLERAGFTGKYVVSNLPPFAAASLALMGISDDRIDATVLGPTLFKRAWFTTAIHHQNVHKYPEVYFAFRDVFQSIDVAGERRFSERLWLDRGAHALNEGRDLVNRDEILDLVRRYGFEVVDMGALSVHGQVAAARGMTVLAGAHGSQFVHAMFMPERSTIVECFSPLHVNPSILEICRVMRHRYFQVVPQHTVFSPYQWDKALKLFPLQLELVLQSLE